MLQFIKQAELSRFTLYNLKQDPAEQNNLAAKQPQRLEKLKKRMVSLYEEIQAEGPEIEMYRKSK